MSPRGRVALALLLVAASSVAMRGEQVPIEATRLQGASIPEGGTPLVDGTFRLVGVRLSVAHEARESALHATALHRDHFILEVDLRQEFPTTQAWRVQLLWNDASAGALQIAPPGVGKDVTLTFGLGEDLLESNGYALQLAST